MRALRYALISATRAACSCQSPSNPTYDGCSTYDDPRCISGACPGLDAGSTADGGADAG